MQTEEIKQIIEEEKLLASYEGEDKIISSLEMEKKIGEEKSVFKFSSPFAGLNELIEGFEAGELIIVSAYPKHGKTSLCLDFMAHFISQGIQCLFFSFEMPPRQLFSRFEEVPLFYLPQTLKDKDLNWIEKRIQEAKIKYDCKVIFVDHLLFLADLAKIKNTSLEIGSIVRRLKTIAINNDLVIFLVSHTTKQEMDKTPSVADLRDSGLIACEADSTLMLWRPLDRKTKEFVGEETILSVENHRRTGAMKKMVKLYFNKQTNRFKENEPTL